MRGRKPKPTVLKLLDGNPGKRTINDREPTAAGGIPELPDWLDDEAKAEWYRIVRAATTWASSAGPIGRRWRRTAPPRAAGCRPRSRSGSSGRSSKSPEKGFPMKSPYLIDRRPGDGDHAEVHGRVRADPVEPQPHSGAGSGDGDGRVRSVPGDGLMADLLAEAGRRRSGGWDEWIRSEADERAVLEGCTFDITAAERVRDVLPASSCGTRKGNGPNKPFELLDWQWREVVAPLFGWKRPDGTRRYRRGYIEVPKKNGKSTLFSGLSLYLLAGDQRARRRGLQRGRRSGPGVDRVQRGGQHGRGLADASTSRLHVVRSTKRITFLQKQSFYQALSADVPAKEGSECPCRPDRRAARPEEPRPVGHAPLRRRIPPPAAAPEHHDGRLRPAFDLLGAARLRREGADGRDRRLCVLRATSRPPARRTTGPIPRSGRRPTPASGSRSTRSSSPRTAGKRRSRRPRRTRSAAIGSTSGPSRTSAG